MTEDNSNNQRQFQEQYREEKVQNHRVLFVTIALGVALVLRLYPALYHGAPWGTDGWPLIKDAQQLLANTPTGLGGNSVVFADQYNVYWPASVIFGSIGSLMFDSAPLQTMPLVIPIVGAISTLIFFVIVERLTKNTTAAFIASLIFTTSSFDSIFTASATKETFAYPLFMVGVLLLVLSMRKFDSKLLGLFVLDSFILVTAHFALAMILSALTCSVFIGQIVLSLARDSSTRFDFRLIFMPFVSVAVVASYFATYALPGLPISIGISDALSVSSFLILSITVALYFTSAKKKIPVILPALIFAAALAILLISTLVPIVPFEPVTSPNLVFDATPYIAVGLLALIGYGLSQKSLRKDHFAFLAIWLAVPLGISGYAMFGTSNGLEIIYRLFTFVYAPATIFAGIALTAFFLEKKDHDGSSVPRDLITQTKRTAVILCVVAIASLGAYQSYAAVVQGQNLLGGQWGYLPSDLSAGAWVRASSISSAGNITISGDSKIFYLFDQYYGVSVNMDSGYQIIFLDDNGNGGGDMVTNISSSPLITDQIMQQDGYNIALYGYPLPSNWLINLTQSANLIYNNGNDKIWY